jgi:voltage-gated potassium channel
MKNLREKLSVIIDDGNIKTNKYSAFFNYSIFIIIIISVIEIILEVDPEYNEYGALFSFIDAFTIIVFTIEYILRFWTADLIDIKYKGIKGRLVYFFSFYNLIDFIAIVPFYASFFIVGSAISVFKVLRIVRVLRILKYIKSFAFVMKAIGNKKRELAVSMQVLLIFTFVLSVFMYNVENKAQPDDFGTIWDAVMWSVSKFIGGIGGY